MSIQFSSFCDFFLVFNIINKTSVPIAVATIYTIFQRKLVDNVDKPVYKSQSFILSHFSMWITMFSILWKLSAKIHFLYNLYKFTFVKRFSPKRYILKISENRAGANTGVRSAPTYCNKRCRASHASVCNTKRMP